MLLYLPIILFYSIIPSNRTYYSRYKLDKFYDNCTATLLQSSRDSLCWYENEFPNKEKAHSAAADDS